MKGGKASSVEAEIKLAATPGVLSRLAGDPRLGERRGAPLELTAIYFDTPRHSLWRNGFTLRVRRERGRWVQTLKGGGSLESGLHRRLELSAPTSRALPSLALLDDAAVRKQVAAIVRKATLVPVFRIEVSRQLRMAAPHPGVRVEVCLDRGEILAKHARAAVSEVELELKRGEPRHLFEMALALAERSAVRVESRSKAERGYELAGVIRPSPVRSQLAISARGISVGAALKEMCIACLNHLQANQPGVMQGADPEYLHQARVALRRLHAGLLAFRRVPPRGFLDPLVDAVRTFLRALGPARDWDVFARNTLAPVLEQSDGHDGLAGIAAATDRLRDEANRKVRRLFASRRYQRLVLGLGVWLERQPWLEQDERRAWEADVENYAVHALDRYHRRVRRRGRHIETLDAKELHRLRIATKKLRYAAIFFAPLFPRRRSAELLAAVNDLQDLLGAINDCATAQALLDEAIRSTREPKRAQARTIVGHWNAAQLEERKRELPAAWKAFRRAERFWR